MKKNQNNPVNPAQKNIVDPEQRKANHNPDTTADRAHTDIKRTSKSHTIPNSGGQSANQTDNKQATVNRGNTDSGTRGKNN